MADQQINSTPCTVDTDCPDLQQCDPNTKTCVPGAGTNAGYIVPAADDTTEQSWIDQVLAKGREMIADWKQTRIAYMTMAGFRTTVGEPVIDADWTQERDDQYWLVNTVVLTLAKYLGEVDEGTRSVAYDTFGDQIAVLGDPGDVQFSVKDGVLYVTQGSVQGKVDPAGFTAGAPLIIAVVIVGGIVCITEVISISQAIRALIDALVKHDQMRHEEKIAADEIAGGVDPQTAHKDASDQTNALIKAQTEAAKAAADAESKSQLSQFMDMLKTTLWVGLGVAIVASVIYFGAPLFEKAMASKPRQLAMQNPVSRRRVLGTTGDVNMFDYDAGVVFSDENGTHWEWWNWDDESDESSKAKVTVYRDDVADDVWADKDWAEIESVASSIGADVEELREAGKSSNVMDRVWALESIVGYYGPNELDQYPLNLTRSEFKKRWRNVDPRKVRKNPSGPKPINGYAYVLGGYSTGTADEWKRSRDHRWDTEVIDDSDGPFSYVGERIIDGSQVNVWKRSDGKFIAQLEHMTRGESGNPRKGSAVAKHGGYVWGTTYETWDEESLEAGETDDKGWEHEYEDHGPYKSLADLLQDIPSHSWLEWSSSSPGPHSWIISERDEDRAFFEKGEETIYSLHFKHADGTDLTQSEVNFIDQKIFGKRRGRAESGNPTGVDLTSVSVVRVDAGQDKNGNPRRAFVIMAPDGIIAAVDEEHMGEGALSQAFGGDRDLGHELALKYATGGTIATTPSEYRALLKNFPPRKAKLPSVAGPDTMVLHLNAGNDTNGNPRRVFLIFQHGEVVEAVDEGYQGIGAIPKKVQPLVVAQLATTPAEYRNLLRIFKTRAA